MVDHKITSVNSTLLLNGNCHFWGQSGQTLFLWKHLFREALLKGDKNNGICFFFLKRRVQPKSHLQWQSCPRDLSIIATSFVPPYCNHLIQLLRWLPFLRTSLLLQDLTLVPRGSTLCQWNLYRSPSQALMSALCLPLVCPWELFR